MTVDEILASGRYTDRRGRVWEKAAYLPEWFCLYPRRMIRASEMRLLIERDKHRCPNSGLGDCIDHPAVSVTKSILGSWAVYGVKAGLPVEKFATFPEALDAARALAVGE